MSGKHVKATDAISEHPPPDGQGHTRRSLAIRGGNRFTWYWTCRLCSTRLIDLGRAKSTVKYYHVPPCVTPKFQCSNEMPTPPQGKKGPATPPYPWLPEPKLSGSAHGSTQNPEVPGLSHTMTRTRRRRADADLPMDPVEGEWTTLEAKEVTELKEQLKKLEAKVAEQTKAGEAGVRPPPPPVPAASSADKAK